MHDVYYSILQIHALMWIVINRVHAMTGSVRVIKKKHARDPIYMT